MGLALIEDFPGRAGLHKDPEHLLRPAGPVIDLGVELSVGKGPGAPLAKLDIGQGVQAAGLPVFFDIRRPLLHAPAALDQERLIAVLRQKKGAEKACRPRSDDNRPVTHDLPAAIGKSVDPARGQGHILVFQTPDQDGLLPLLHPRVHIHRIDV